ncbi:MAG: hypothetical protein KBA61_13525 [Spirochaetes bacterium]|nr:hypothetical protein [Spirochaetota bacterium]HPA71366.1 hypothetical protein [Spirochaetota bacterium]
MLKRTPLLANIIGGAMAILVILIFEEPGRPFTMGQGLLLYLLCVVTSMGIAMFFDPNAKKAKEEFLKINFYEEKK